MSPRDLPPERSSGLIALDGPVRTLFERIAGPATHTAPDLASIGTALVAFAADVDYLASWVQRIGDGTGGLPVHTPARGPRLTIVHRGAGEMSVVHDHGTWVAITPILGLETHRRYRVVRAGPAARLELAEVLALEQSQVATLMPPDEVHDHGNLAGHGAPAYVLIMTGDDQMRFTRNEWDLITGHHRVLRPGDGSPMVASQAMPQA